MIINCIIIDDEPLSRKGLKEYVLDSELLNLAGEFGHPLKAMNILAEMTIHLVFLDIQMPKLTGIEFIRSLQHPPLVIFTTAYPQFAVDGFELNAVDYLLKPFSFDRFLKAVIKAKSILEGRIEPAAGVQPVSSDHIFIKADNKILKIRFEEILFAEALQNYVAIHTATRKYITYLTLRNLQEQLPGDRFVKIHKSYIVATDRVDGIAGNEVMIGTHRLPVSRTCREEVLEAITRNRLVRRP